MKEIHVKINNFLAKYQVSLLWLGIAIVTLLIVLVFVNWYTLIQLGILKNDANHRVEQEMVEEIEDTVTVVPEHPLLTPEREQSIIDALKDDSIEVDLSTNERESIKKNLSGGLIEEETTLTQERKQKILEALNN